MDTPNITPMGTSTSLLRTVVMLMVSLYTPRDPVLTMHVHVPLCAFFISSILILQLSMYVGLSLLISGTWCPKKVIWVPPPPLQMLLPVGFFSSILDKMWYLLKIYFWSIIYVYKLHDAKESQHYLQAFFSIGQNPLTTVNAIKFWIAIQSHIVIPRI